MIHKIAILSVLTFGGFLFLMGVWAIEFMNTTIISQMTPDDWLQAVTMVLIPMLSGLFFILVSIIESNKI
tara:strand:- start:1344 stop:1553 length:210 start_codon:yes stop_codon:yes gene_type:complete